MDVRDEGGDFNIFSNLNLIFLFFFYDYVFVSFVYVYFAVDLKIVIDIFGMVVWIFNSKVKSLIMIFWDRKGMWSVFKVFLENF